MAEKHPVIVIGAGAAGMMAAGRAAELGARVLLLEKMERPGKKILISGNGRCNLTNARELKSFIDQFGANGSFLQPAFSRFFRNELIGFMRRYGVECKVKPAGKIYPVTENARDVVRAFECYLAEGGVEVRFGVKVTGVAVENGKVSGVQTPDGFLPASTVVMAAGGSSHPQTGSTGDGYSIAATLGHTIVRLRPGLVPLVADDTAKAKHLQGASLRQARITAFQCPAVEIDPALVPKEDAGRGIAGKPPVLPLVESRTGDAIILYFGIGGPVILEMSLAIIDALERGPVSVTIDLVPRMTKDDLRRDLQQRFDANPEMAYQRVIKDMIARNFAGRFISLSGAEPEKPGAQVTSEDRDRLVDLMKDLRFDIKEAYSHSTAMVTAGGVALNEINPATMASRLVGGLYFCGEIMDVDAGTGGYNLQAAFSTGYVAGEAAALTYQ